MNNLLNKVELKYLFLILAVLLIYVSIFTFLFFKESEIIFDSIIRQNHNLSNSSNLKLTSNINSSSSSLGSKSSYNSTTSQANSTTQSQDTSYDISYIASSSSQTQEVLKIHSNATPVFMYHYVDDRKIDPKKDPIGYNLTVKSKVFENDMKQISLRKYKTLFASELVDYNSLPKDHYLSLTFDDGYEDFYTTAFPILKKYHLKSTIYIITSDVGKTGYLTLDQLKELSETGLVEIGSHTLTHPNLQTSSIENQKKQIFESKKILEDKLKIKVNSFCYPSGKFSDDTVKLVEEAGYTNATTTIGGYFQKSKNLFEIYRFRVSPEGIQKYL